MTDLDPTPIAPITAQDAVQSELRHVRALMQLEQKEDQAQFKLKNASASIKERRRRGLTWYPVTITQEDIGFGGKVVLVGDSSTLGRHPFFVELLAYVKGVGGYRTAQTVVR